MRLRRLAAAHAAAAVHEGLPCLAVPASSALPLPLTSPPTDPRCAAGHRPGRTCQCSCISPRLSLLPSLPPQIGDVLLDVNPGIPPRFRQDVAIVSAQSKRCVMLGPVSLRMVASPNVETLLDPEEPLPAWQRTGAAAAAAAGGAAAAAARGKRAVVLDDDDQSSEEAEAMDVDGAAVAAANGAGQGPAAEQQDEQQAGKQQQQQRAGKQLQGVAVKSEGGEEEEVVSPRRGGLRSPRGRKAAGGGGGAS